MGDLEKKDNKIIKAAAFLAVLMILIIAVSFMVKPKYGEVYDISKTNRKLTALSEEKNGIDVFFAGDSVVYRSISPLQIYEEAGFTSYDLSDSALRLCDAVSMVEAGFEIHPPKLIVLETDALFTDTLPHRDVYAHPTNFIEDILPVFHYHVFYKQWLPSVAAESSAVELHRLLKGYEYTDSVIAYEGSADYMKEGPKKVRMTDECLEYLEELNSFASKNELELLLVTVPRPAGWNDAKHNVTATWAEEHNLSYIDLNNEDIGIDWTKDTMDGGDHMSFEGSQKVSNYLGKYIMANYSLEDHREDSEYDSWSVSYREAGIY